MPKRTRLLYVVHGFPPEVLAGTELNSLWLAQKLSKKFDIHIFTGTRNPSLKAYSTVAEEFSGLKIRRIKIPFTKSVYPIDLYFDWRIDELFEKYIDEIKPSLIHIHHVINLSTGIIEQTASRAIPMTLHIRDFYYICPKIFLFASSNKSCKHPPDESECAECIRETSDIRGEKLRSIHSHQTIAKAIRDRMEYMKRLLSLPDIIICPSKFMKKELVKFGVQPNRIEVHKDGAKQFTPIKRSQNSKISFGYLGGLWLHKGSNILLEAFSRLDQSKTRLFIFGGGDDDLIKRSKSLYGSLKITFMDKYSHEELPNILSRFDVLVHPSICHESYSLVVHEALAAQIPVLVSDIPAQREDVKNGINGFRFKVGDPNDLKHKMEMLLENPELLNTMKKHKTKVQTVIQQAKEMESIYNKLSRRGKKHARGDSLIQLARTRQRVEIEISRLESELIKPIARGPILGLLGLYSRRPDLQKVFPEVNEGKYSRLLQWARHEADITNELFENAEWYKENELALLVDELDKTRTSLMHLENEMKKTEIELKNTRIHLNHRESVIQHLENELTRVKRELENELTRVKRELDLIKDSLGYKLIWFYSRKIDRLFPEGTRRRELLKRIASRLRTIVG